MVGDGVLGVLGVQAEQVAAVSEMQSRGIPESLAEAFAIIKAWYEFGAKHIPSEIYPEAFFTALFRGWVQERRVDKTSSNIAGHHEEYLQLDTGDSVDFEETAGRTRLINHFTKDERYYSFFVTDKDLVGLGPLGIQTGDVVGIVLGCHVLLVLRRCHDEAFQIVGPAYVHGLSDAQALLGPIQYPWVAKIDSRNAWVYLNSNTGEVSPEDPRLGPLPNGWEEVSPGRFRVSGTVEIIDEDPRWMAESLKERGVPLKTFHLV